MTVGLTHKLAVVCTGLDFTLRLACVCVSLLLLFWSPFLCVSTCQLMYTLWTWLWVWFWSWLLFVLWSCGFDSEDVFCFARLWVWWSNSFMFVRGCGFDSRADCVYV